MGIGKFQPPTKSIPLNQSTKKSAQLITSARGPYTKFDTNPPTGGFWANGWNITKIIFLFILFFSQARAQVRPVDGFLHVIAQKTWNHAKMCLLGVWFWMMWVVYIQGVYHRWLMTHQPVHYLITTRPHIILSQPGHTFQLRVRPAKSRPVTHHVSHSSQDSPCQLVNNLITAKPHIPL